MDKNVQIKAADWVARLSGSPGESDWLAFEAWLAASASHRVAYDRAMAFWLSVDPQAEPLAVALEDLADRRTRPATAWWAAGVSAAAAVAVTFAVQHPARAPEVVYSTGNGEQRSLVLQDGTHVTMNSRSKISVRLERGLRTVTLAQGEVALEVVHDAARPFEVHAGDQILRDLGTEFDVVRANGQIDVTVRQGLVDVRPVDGRQSVSLRPGSRLEHREGATQSMIIPVSADDAFSWRTGRLVYRDRPLSEIAADLNRYGEDQVRPEGAVANLHFSGVLAIGDQATMVRRLTALLPLSASRQDGVVTLHGVNTTR